MTIVKALAGDWGSYPTEAGKVVVRGQRPALTRTPALDAAARPRGEQRVHGDHDEVTAGAAALPSCSTRSTGTVGEV